MTNIPVYVKCINEDFAGYFHLDKVYQGYLTSTTFVINTEGGNLIKFSRLSGRGSFWLNIFREVEPECTIDLTDL